MQKPKRLSWSTTVTIRPTAPFAFDPTFHKPDHFTSGDNDWQPGTRWQTCNWHGRSLGITFVNTGTVVKPAVSATIYAAKPLTADTVHSLTNELIYRFNLQLNLKDFYHAFRSDAFLTPLLKRWRGMRPGHPSSLYEYLVIGIVLQNASVRRSVQMFKALLERYGTLLEFDGKQLWCFWSPGSLMKSSGQELRDLKVGYRAKSLQRIDEQFAQGLIDEFHLRTTDRQAQMQTLLTLYGVGPATVWYLLFDVFHHWDFFNHISPWEQKIYSKLFFNRDPEHPVSVTRLLRHFKRYGQYRQLAVHYIWEDLWWKRTHEHIPWLEKEIRL